MTTVELQEDNIKAIIMLINEKINNTQDEEIKDDLSSIRMELIDAILK